MDVSQPAVTAEGIRVYRPEDFEGMRVAGRLAAEILDQIAPYVVPGAATGELDARIEAAVNAAGAVSATIGYRGYRHASCISVNHVVCHGIPGPKRLKDGDILNIDVTVIVDGWYGDSSRMYVAGKPARRAERLIDVTHEALMRGIAEVKPGNTFGDIGAAILQAAHLGGEGVFAVFDCERTQWLIKITGWADAAGIDDFAAAPGDLRRE